MKHGFVSGRPVRSSNIFRYNYQNWYQSTFRNRSNTFNQNSNSCEFFPGALTGNWDHWMISRVKADPKRTAFSYVYKKFKIYQSLDIFFMIIKLIHFWDLRFRDKILELLGLKWISKKVWLLQFYHLGKKIKFISRHPYPAAHIDALCNTLLKKAFFAFWKKWVI